MRFSLPILALGLLAVMSAGCGQSSKISPSVETRTTAEDYGDGEHIIRKVVMPLSDQMISSYDSPISRMTFLTGGFAKLFMDLGAGMNMGRTQMTLIQPVPEIPRDNIKSAVIKRVFFYIEPKDGKRKPTTWQRLRGRAGVDFKFLDKLAVKVSPHNVENVHTWNPHYEIRKIRAGEYTPLMSLFDGSAVHNEIKNPEDLEDLVIIKYASNNRHKFLKPKKFGNVFIFNTKQPIKLKRYFEAKRFKRYFNTIHVLHGKKTKKHPKPTGAVIVELNKGRLYDEGLRVVLAEDAIKLSNLGVEMVDECDAHTCLDLNLPKVDIIPLISRGNAIKIDTFMDAKKAPESFQLKGFIEMEVKFKLAF